MTGDLLLLLDHACQAFPCGARGAASSLGPISQGHPVCLTANQWRPVVKDTTWPARMHWMQYCQNPLRCCQSNGCNSTAVLLLIPLQPVVSGPGRAPCSRLSAAAMLAPLFHPMPHIAQRPEHEVRRKQRLHATLPNRCFSQAIPRVSSISSR